MLTMGVAGHLCLDLSPRLPGAADTTPGRLVDVGPLSVGLGGSVANTGGSLLALGARVVPSAVIGDDEVGELTRSRLRTSGFDTAGIAVAPGATSSYSLVIETPGSDRTFWHHTGANDVFDGTGVDLDGLDVLHLGYPPLLPALTANDGEPLRALLARARAAGITTSVDLAVVDPGSRLDGNAWRRILTTMAAETDVLSPSLDDLTSALRIDEPFSEALVDRLAGELVDAGAGVVAISAGAHGLFVRTGSEHTRAAPASAGTPVTTNGAGDAASAGLIFALALGASLGTAAELASVCSAIVISGRRPTPDVVIGINPQLAPLFERPLT